MDVDREIIELLVDDDDDTVVDTNDLGDRVVVDLTDDVEDEPPSESWSSLSQLEQSQQDYYTNPLE